VLRRRRRKRTRHKAWTEEKLSEIEEKQKSSTSMTECQQLRVLHLQLPTTSHPYRVSHTSWCSARSGSHPTPRCGLWVAQATRAEPSSSEGSRHEAGPTRHTRATTKSLDGLLVEAAGRHPPPRCLQRRGGKPQAEVDRSPRGGTSECGASGRALRVTTPAEFYGKVVSHVRRERDVCTSRRDACNPSKLEGRTVTG
jgi:hypothetical protein